MKRNWQGLLLLLGVWAGLGKSSYAQQPLVLPPLKANESANTSAQPVLGDEAWLAPASRGVVVGGAGGAQFLHPVFQSNPAFRVNYPDGSSSIGGFRQNVDPAPQGWFGIRGENDWGVRVRYFQYAQSSSASTVNPGGGITIDAARPLGLASTSLFANERVAAFSDLNVLAWDFEVTKRLCRPQWIIDVAAGARYAHLSQSYNAYIGEGPPPLPPPPPAPAPPIPSAFDLDYSNNFNGAGPTFALDLHRQIGSTSLAVYCNSRLSVLFGITKQNGHLEESKAGVIITTTDLSSTFAEVITVGELEFGLECNKSWGRLTTILQAGFVGQVWWGAGNASNNNDTLTASNHSNLGFIGLSLRAGFQF